MGKRVTGVQLDVDELVADHVREDQDGIVSALIFGVGEVGWCLVMSRQYANCIRGSDDGCAHCLRHF